MFTEPKIITTSDLTVRSYILFYFNGKRCREYNGNSLELKIFPNRAKSTKERDKLLNKLLFELKKALESGWNPEVVKVVPVIIIPPIVENPKTVEQAFLEIEADKLSGPLSHNYKLEIKSAVKRILKFLTDDEKQAPIKDLPSMRIEAYLNQFKATATYYMYQRRVLASFYSEFLRKKYVTENFIKSTPRIKLKASLHKIYTKEQLKALLKYLKANSPDLYLCTLISYGCLLRPHQEIRLLNKSHFNEDYSTISLSGSENKSKRVRKVGVPTYVQDVLKDRLNTVTNPDANIFSLRNSPYNEYYFSLNWTRLRGGMIEEGVLQPDQTIYSFRHTAAVDIYKRTKDISTVQQLMGHSTMVVTLNYMRGLGELNSEELRSILPSLEM